MSGPTVDTAKPTSLPPPSGSALDRWFRISERGSTPGREVRGGLATFFTMAYILVLNPIILGSAVDRSGHHLSSAQLVTATALVAAVMTAVMGLGGNLPLAIAAGLGLNAVVAFQLAPRMSWPDAMGLVVLEGLLICVLVATGLREAIMNAIPQAIKQAISVGIGLFIAFIGFIDAGFASRIPDAAKTTVPVQLGGSGTLSGWPVLVFCLGVLLTVALVARRVKGAILISIVVMTVVAIIVNEVADVPAAAWGLTVPKMPHDVVASPDFGLLGHFSLFGGFAHAGVVTAALFVFTLVLSDFFDAMGTIVGISNEAGLLDEQGRVPNIGRVLFIDGAAAVAGGAASCSSNTAYVESAAGVGEGARTGLASVVTGALFAVTLFLAPLAAVVPSQAAAPALVAVGFLLMAQVRNIDWTQYDIAIPAFLTIAVMPFTYSITNGIGAGFLSFVAIKAALGKWRDVHPLVWGVSVCFVAYFAIDPLQQLLGAK
ncbi:NCS2 family permease [Actinacidiphila rubida]|uniref:Putative MFS transporter, AGZA family, xanthine/uracil permease n=1 Tax=Actinacidiphila rubida TaxID=310780 RepID=A0A1H8NFD5_9ACTN|nr:NCS2 family permease [Actinacidiphila rubida]SEO28314.1 putative MFS transporter, AGZA family, xanthine/uracil permease [Actinacidiphila rubida]